MERGIVEGLQDAGELTANEILDALGLVRKADQPLWLWPALGGLVIGLFAGVGLGLAFAPRRGDELRRELGEKLKARDYAGLAESAKSAIAGGSSTRPST